MTCLIMGTPIMATANHLPRHLVAGLLGAGLAIMVAPMPTHAQDIAVLVNGDAISAREIEQRTKCEFAVHKTPICQETVDQLIDEKLKLQLAKRYDLEIADNDLDEAFGDMAKRMAMDSTQLNQVLVDGGCDAATIKSRLKADLAWGRIGRGWFLPGPPSARYLRELRRAARIEKVDQTAQCTAP